MSLRQSDYACALIVQEGKILLGQRAAFRKTYPGKWDVIGGKVETGESLETALVRECGEEIGIVPTDFTFAEALVDHALPVNSPPTYHFFLVTGWTGGAPRMVHHEHSDMRWFTAEEVTGLKGLAHADYPGILSRALKAA